MSHNTRSTAICIASIMSGMGSVMALLALTVVYGAAPLLIQGILIPLACLSDGFFNWSRYLADRFLDEYDRRSLPVLRLCWWSGGALLVPLLAVAISLWLFGQIPTYLFSLGQRVRAYFDDRKKVLCVTDSPKVMR